MVDSSTKSVDAILPDMFSSITRKIMAVTIFGAADGSIDFLCEG